MTLEINLKNLRENYQKVQNLIGADVQIMPIVKVNAYGHGLLRVARELIRQGAGWLGVADIEEASILRREYPEVAIVILYPIFSTDFSKALSGDIRLTIDSQDQLNFLHTQARILGRRAHIHIKVNTGMNRFGAEAERTIDLVEKAKSYQNILVEGIFSHFYDAGNPSATLKQWQKFNEVLFDLQRRNLEIPLRHLASSAAILNFDKSFFEIVRPGALLYGLIGRDRLNLQPVLSWKAKILKLRRIKKGECVSYGCQFKAKKDMDVAVVGVGYADGYTRTLSGKAQMLVKGRRCRVIGNINMKHAFIDISPAMRVSKKLSPRVGDEAVLIGAQGREEILADELAGWAKTDVREIVSRIPREAAREYVEA